MTRVGQLVELPLCQDRVVQCRLDVQWVVPYLSPILPY
jgi:hypothetical protein